MRRELKVRLWHALDRANAIADLLGARTFEEYTSDQHFRAALERHLEIIGESLSKAVQMEPGLADSITEFAGIIAVRNRLAHGYDALDDETLWKIAHDKVPRLLAEVRALLPSP
jgi:uncharacterized protein with HEPN domain